MNEQQIWDLVEVSGDLVLRVRALEERIRELEKVIEDLEWIRGRWETDFIPRLATKLDERGKEVNSNGAAR